MGLAEAGVSTRVARPILAGLLVHGVDVESTLAAVGLDAETLADAEARIPHRAVARLWQVAAERSGVPTFGLRVVEEMELDALDVQLYAFLSSANLGEGLERAIWCHRLNHDAPSLSLTRTATQAIYRHRLPGGHILPAAAAQFVVGVLVKATRAAAGVDVSIDEIRFVHAAPPDTSDYDRILNAPVKFSAQDNEVVFPVAALEIPHLKADAGLAAVLHRHAEALLEKLPQVDSLADRVRVLLANELQGGNPSADTVAENLRMSTRTLARRLADENTSHKEILDGLRSDLAQRYLRDANLAIGEVAFLLGFSEPSAFHRAFKRWTGQTPADFRTAP